MRVLSADKLNVILEKHKKWLYGDESSERADLRGVDLDCANLQYADLGCADLLGDIEYWEGLINIAKSAGDGMKPTTLMHELVHAITYEQMGHGFEHDEQYIDGLAAGIIMLIRDNPKLVDYILSSGKVSVDE